MRPLRRVAVRLALVGGLGLGASPMTAQPAAARDSQPFAQTLATDPLLLPVGIFSLEYEHALPTAGLSLGVGGTYVGPGSPGGDAWVEGKLLYYPGELALRGFAIGLTAGFHRAVDEVSTGTFGAGSTSARSETAPTLGVVLDYNWLIGRSRRFLVGVGLGATRVLRNVSNSPLDQTYPRGRFAVGLAF